MPISSLSPTALIYMGGTFGCVGTPLAPMPAGAFLQRLRSLVAKDFAHVDFFAAPRITDSSQLCARDWLELVQFIHGLQQQSNYQHFVLIHGTDTLHYAAAMLHHCLAPQLSLLITGSQYPLLTADATQRNPQSDAWQNLTFALQQIQQIPHGVYIGFNQRLFAGHTGFKVHTEDDAAFIGQSTPTPSLQTDLSQIDWAVLDQLNLVNLYLYPSQGSQLSQQLAILLQQPPHILIIQAFGAGNLPSSPIIIEQFRQLLQRGCWLILSSQVLYGQLSQKYAVSSWLQQLDIVIDPHFSQADLYARAVLNYACFHQHQDWQSYWNR